jgi:hypothetical protein
MGRCWHGTVYSISASNVKKGVELHTLVIIACASSQRSLLTSQRGDSTIHQKHTIWMMLERAWSMEGILQAQLFMIRKVPYVVQAATIAPRLHSEL